MPPAGSGPEFAHARIVGAAEDDVVGAVVFSLRRDLLHHGAYLPVLRRGTTEVASHGTQTHLQTGEVGQGRLNVSVFSNAPGVSMATRLPFLAVFALCLAAVSVAAESQHNVTYFDNLSMRINESIRAGRYIDALVPAQEFAGSTEKAFGERSVQHAAAVTRLATVIHLLGRYRTADPLFEKALMIYRQVLPPDHPDVATALNNLGMQRHWLGNDEQAAQLLQEALLIREKKLPPSDAAIIESLNNLAHIYKYLERNDQAALLLKRALILLADGTADDQRRGQTLQNLASTLEVSGDLKGAEAHLRRALKSFRKAVLNTHPIIATALNRLAVNLFLQGRAKEASGIFAEALRAQREAASPSKALLAATLEAYGMNELSQLRPTVARTMLDEALRIRTDILDPNHQDISRTLWDLAEIATQQGQSSEALDFIRRASEIATKAPVIDARLRNQFLRHVGIAAAMANNEVARAELVDESLIMAQYAAHAEVATTISRMAARFAASDEKLQTLIREGDDLDKLRPQLEEAVANGLSQPATQRTAEQNEQRVRLVSLLARRSRITAEVAQNFPEYDRLVHPRPLGVSQIQKMLWPDEVLLQVLTGQTETYVWAITNQDAKWISTPLGETEVQIQIRALRAGLEVNQNQIGRPGRKLFDLKLAHELHERLLSGVAPMMDGKSHMLIVSSNAWAGLPFHLLVKRPVSSAKSFDPQLTAYRSADWLIKSYSFSSLPSVASLQALRAYPRIDKPRRALLGYGNPDFGGRVVGSSEVQTNALGNVLSPNISSVLRGPAVDQRMLQNLVALPETEDELRAVATSLGMHAADLHFQKQATEAAVKQITLVDYRIIYFATHAMVAGEIVGEPSLALTVPNVATDLDDGLLTASEISDLKLNADWVILSACNTGSSEGKNTTGLSGLAQAFFHAGARALLVSHWAVDSDATVALMTTAFAYLGTRPDLRKSEALRQSMLKMISDTREPINAYPSLWAAFTLIGDN